MSLVISSNSTTKSKFHANMLNAGTNHGDNDNMLAVHMLQTKS